MPAIDQTRYPYRAPYWRTHFAPPDKQATRIKTAGRPLIRVFLLLITFFLVIQSFHDASAGTIGERFRASVVKNLTQKRFWVPLAAAAVFLADGNALDKDTLRWTEDNGIMSRDFAKGLSDAVAFGVLPAGTLLTLFYTDNRNCLLCVELGALGATYLTVEPLKQLTNRMRPDFVEGDGKKSFPSGHTAIAFSFATLSNRNIEEAGLGWAGHLYYLNYFLASSVAWARVEAKRHYPSDVLVGASLGMLVSSVIYDTFLSDYEDASIYIGPGEHDTVMISMSWKF